MFQDEDILMGHILAVMFYFCDAFWMPIVFAISERFIFVIKPGCNFWNGFITSWNMNGVLHPVLVRPICSPAPDTISQPGRHLYQLPGMAHVMEKTNGIIVS